MSVFFQFNQGFFHPKVDYKNVIPIMSYQPKVKDPVNY